MFRKKKDPSVKVAEMWLEILKGKSPEEIIDMAKELKQIRVWVGDHWEVEAYELLLEDNGVTTVAVDTNGQFEVVHGGRFISAPLDRGKKGKIVYEKLKALKPLLDRRYRQ